MTIRTLFFYLSAVILGSSIRSAAIGPIDFETAGDLAGNFRLYGNVPDVSQTGPAAGNDYVIYQHSSQPRPPGQVGLFDTTPGDGSTTQSTFSGNLRVEFDLSTAQRNSRFGVWFIDPGNASHNLLAWFGMDVLSTRDIIRFFKNGDPVSGNPPSFGVFAGGTAPTMESGADVSLDSAPTWSHLTVDYWVDSGVPTISLTVGSLTAVSTYEAADALPANVEVAFYLLDQPSESGAKLDNFSITQVVPEPSAMMLLILGALPLYRRCRA